MSEFRAGFFQHLHKLFGNIDAITYFKPPDFTNRQILTQICGCGKEIFLQIWSYHWQISIGRCTYISYVQQLRKCSHVVTAEFLDHDKLQKTDLKPLQLVKSEWTSPLQQLAVPSVITKFFRIDSTKYSCVHPSVWCAIFYFCIKLNQQWTYSFTLYVRMNMCWLFL